MVCIRLGTEFCKILYRMWSAPLQAKERLGCDIKFKIRGFQANLRRLRGHAQALEKVNKGMSSAYDSHVSPNPSLKPNPDPATLNPDSLNPKP